MTEQIGDGNAVHLDKLPPFVFIRSLRAFHVSTFCFKEFLLRSIYYSHIPLYLQYWSEAWEDSSVTFTPGYRVVFPGLQ